MSERETFLMPLLNRLLLRVDLTQSDKDAVLALPQSVRELAPGEHLVRQGDRPSHCCLMISGFTVREKDVATGARQILAVHMAGEMVDLQNVLLERSDHDVRSLTQAKVVIIPRTALEEFWLETLVDASVFREWIANVGRRDARARIAHLLCEFAVRLEAAGLAETGSYELPMSQDQLADAVAMTPVHVNRTLMALGKEKLIERDRRSVRISNWEKLAEAADFDPGYLHLPERSSKIFH
jgi:CRP-like cAMP-binding protein